MLCVYQKFQDHQAFPSGSSSSLAFCMMFASHIHIYYIHERSQSHVCVGINDMSEIYITLPLFLAFHGCWEVIYY